MHLSHLVRSYVSASAHHTNLFLTSIPIHESKAINKNYLSYYKKNFFLQGFYCPEEHFSFWLFNSYTKGHYSVEKSGNYSLKLIKNLSFISANLIS